MEQSWLLQVGLKVNEDSWGTDAIAATRARPSFASWWPSSPSPFSQKRRRGVEFKVPLPFWERDLG